MKRLILTGVTGCRNRGVEALVRPVLERFSHEPRIGGIRVLSWTPDYDGARLDLPEVSFERQSPPVRKGRGARLKEQIRAVCSTVGLTKPRGVGFSAGDLLVVSGGDLFGSEYSTTHLAAHLEPVEEAQAKGIPVCFLGHSIGPFARPHEAALWKAVAEKVDLITVREPLSYRYVTEKLGLSKDRVHLTGDVGFLLEPDHEVGAALRRHLGIDPERKCVALSISESISGWTGLDNRGHLDGWLAVIRGFLDDYDTDVIIVPHVQEPYGNDERVGTEILRRLGHDPRVKLAAGDYSAAEFKALMSTCEFVVAERMHAAIGALSCHVPTLAVSYSVKAAGIMGSLLDQKWLEDGLVTKVEDFVEPGRAKEIISGLYPRRAEIRATLEKSVPETKAAAKRNFELFGKTFLQS